MMRRRRFLPFLPFAKPLPLVDIQDPRSIFRCYRAFVMKYERLREKFPRFIDDERGLWSGRKRWFVGRGTVSERGFAEAEGVGDHGNGAEAHCRAGQHRAKQPAVERVKNTGGDGDANHVVKKSPSEILLDVANRGATQLARAYDSTQIAFEKRDAGVFDGHLRAGTHGDTDIGSRKRGSVVDAVAGHRHDASFFLQAPDDF